MEHQGRGGGEISDLSYPKDLLPAERAQAEVMIDVLDVPLNQQVIDEWAGIIAAGDIRISTLGCLRALIKRAQAGTFTPERGPRVAQARMARERMAAVQAHVEPLALAPVDENNALVRRLMAIGKRATGNDR